MNIEPAILVMHHSLRSHPVISATLLDFLCRILHNFSPTLTSYVRQGINSAFQQILEKRVLPSLEPLFNGKLDTDLKKLIRFTFPELTGSVPPSGEPGSDGKQGPGDSKKRKALESKTEDEAPSFSGEEEEETISVKSVSKKEAKIEQVISFPLNNGGGASGDCSNVRSISTISDPTDVTSHLDQLPPDVREIAYKLMKEKYVFVISTLPLIFYSLIDD